MAYNVLLKTQVQYLLNKLFPQMYSYAECSTGRNTVAKVVPLTGFILKKGAKICVRFTDTGTSNPASGNITLNVNNTGAKTVIIGNSNKTVMTYAYSWELSANKCHSFVYDGANWVFLGRDTNTTNSAGASNKTGTKMFLVGTTAQTNGVTSHSNVNCYIGTDNKLYSNGSKVLSMNDSDNVALLEASDL